MKYLFVYLFPKWWTKISNTLFSLLVLVVVLHIRKPTATRVFLLIQHGKHPSCNLRTPCHVPWGYPEVWVATPWGLCGAEADSLFGETWRTDTQGGRRHHGRPHTSCVWFLFWQKKNWQISWFHVNGWCEWTWMATRHNVIATDPREKTEIHHTVSPLYLIIFLIYSEYIVILYIYILLQNLKLYLR